MVDVQAITYSIASFICALFVLEFGADKFIDHTAIVAQRTGIPQGVIALLTAGAEWEELAVVVVSIARRRSSLAVGNIVGSAISNILGAFALGLVFRRDEQQNQIVFDRSSKIYSCLLLVLTVPVAGVCAFESQSGHHGTGTGAGMWRVVGGVAIGVFAVYIGSIAWFISRGRIAGPEMSDSDGESDGDSRADDSDGDGERGTEEHNPYNTNSSVEGAISAGAETAVPRDNILQSMGNASDQSASETTPFLNRETAQTPSYAASHGNINTNTHTNINTNTNTNTDDDSNIGHHNHNHNHSLPYHMAFLVLGFLATLLSSYVLSHAATTLTDETGISDIVFGIVILSLATTLPEKFIAIISGSRGHTGILVANTVGSNIFLLSLCMGVVWVSTGGSFDRGSVNSWELAVLVASTVLLTGTVCCGAAAAWSRSVGVGMVLAYLGFLVVEVTGSRGSWLD